MKNLGARLDSLIAAIALGERSHIFEGNENGKNTHVVRPRKRRLLSSIDRVMVAMTFAEAGCLETACEYLGCGEGRSVPDSQLTAPSFAEVVGLRGVRLWYGVVEV